MKIFVKELKGKEIQIECDENTKIIDIKLDIESQLAIPGNYSGKKTLCLLNYNLLNNHELPVTQQKLLHLGKILNQDQNKLQSYNIKDNAKLMLTKMAKQPLSKLATSSFGKFYSDEETANVLSKKFAENLKQKLMNEYSLDDIERLSRALLQERQ